MKVKVHYLFSKNKRVGSRLISWGTEHLEDVPTTPSHIALLINNRWVHESTMESGVRVISYDKWLDINEEVAKIPCITEERDYKEIKDIYRSIQDKDYDKFGVIYFGLNLALNKFFNREMPLINKWENKNSYFCCEAVEKLTGIESTSMKAPVQLMVEFNGLHTKS